MPGISTVSIPNLPANLAVTGADLLVTQQQPTSRQGDGTTKITVAQLLALIPQPLPLNYLLLSQQPGIFKDGITDSWQGLVNALATAGAMGVTLVIDCFPYIQMGLDYTRTLFPVSNTNVLCLPGCGLSLDNVGVNAFAFVHAHDCEWRNLTISYIAGTAPSTCGSFGQNAVSFPSGGAFSNALNNCVTVTLTNYLINNFGNSFTNGGRWNETAPTDICAIFNISGDCQRVRFPGLRVSVPDGVTASRFIPAVFALSPQWLPNTVVDITSVISGATAIAPAEIEVTQARFDGTLFGFIGGAVNGLYIKDLESVRYADLQNDSGGQVGGDSDWFPPPHLMYLDPWSSTFAPISGEVQDVFDKGIYVGNPVRRAVSSGTLCCIKTDATSGMKYTNITSLRLDGGLDAQNFGYTNGGEFNNLSITCDSSIATADSGQIFGIRHPSSTPYVGVKYHNVKLIDLNPAPANFPLLGIAVFGSRDNSMTGLKIYVQAWPSNNTAFPGPVFAGDSPTIDGEVYYGSYAATQSNRGVVANQSSFFSTNGTFRWRLYGFRRVPITFTAPPAVGDTSATLTAAWAGFGTQTLPVVFSDGSVRYVTLTNTSTAAIWTLPLTAVAMVNALVQNVIACNFDPFVTRFLLTQAGKGIGNYAHVVDGCNGYIGEVMGNLLVERWIQSWNGTPPAGGAFPVPGIFALGNTSVEGRAWNPTTPLGATAGLTSVGVGYSSAPNAFLTAAPIAAGNLESPSGITPVGGTTEQLLLTPNGGNFDGTGLLGLAIECKRYRACG